MRGLFVTGTDTSVGKTVVAATLVAALRHAGRDVVAVKPVVTGLDEPEAGRPPDHELLAAVAGIDIARVTSSTFGPALSPHLAAELAGTVIDPAALLRHARAAAPADELVIAEGAGGILAPITPDYLMRDLAIDLALPVVIAARPGLGTINHTLLTVECARAAGLDVRGVVMTPWPDEPGAGPRSNRETVARLGAVGVATLSRVGLGFEELAAAGRELPLADWLAT